MQPSPIIAPKRYGSILGLCPLPTPKVNLTGLHNGIIMCPFFSLPLFLLFTNSTMFSVVHTRQSSCKSKSFNFLFFEV